MLRFRSFNCNAFQDLLFIHGFHRVALYSTSISPELYPTFVNYLVQNLGFSKQQALSTSSKFSLIRQARGLKEVNDFNLVKKTTSVITFFKEFGLEQSHIRNAIKFDPRILLCSVDKTLTPKTEALQKLGFSKSEIADVVSVRPSIVVMGLNTTIIPAISALRDIMGTEGDHVVQIIKKLRYFNLSAIPKCLVPNVALLRSYGIPVSLIRKFLCKKPYFFVNNTDFFLSSLISAEEKLGIPRGSQRFLVGAEIFTSLSEKTLESKMQIYKNFGWSDSDISSLVSLNPYVLAISEESLKKKLDFLMNELGYKPSYLASKCNLFTCSLEKRLVPRHKVLIVLKENGLIKESSFPSVVCHTELKFMKKFVLPFKEVHEVYSKSVGINLEMLVERLSKPNSSAL